MEKRRERAEDFSRVYQEMDIEDRKNVALTANKLLIAQNTIRNDQSLNAESSFFQHELPNL